MRVLGLDGGGTSTRVAVREDGRVIARVEGGSIKRLRVGAEVAEANLRALLTEALAGKPAEAASVGMASSTMPGVAEWVTSVLRDFGIPKSEVVGDEVIALDAAVHGGAGILQIAGTGSNCVGRTTTGATEYAGGWSSVLGDEGSGYWIGLNAVRAALRAHDRDEPTALFARIHEAWGTHALDELVNKGNTVPGPDFSQLAPAVTACAEAGDAVAGQVLDKAAEDLADFVLLVREKLRKKHGVTEEVPVAFIGSVLEKSARVRARFTQLLQEAAPGIVVGTEAVVALDGALWRAERLLQ